ncbi:hypothetical protein [Novosphingobium sp.]|uniref:hypothetical protein n=1 Tax=Novosphingobium sp. TaxID=1874826 RepID=UPI003B52F557
MPKIPFAQVKPDYQDKNSILAPPSQALIPTTDSVPFPQGPCIGLYIGGAGNVVGRGPDDTVDVTFNTPSVGQILYYQFSQLSAATTATNLRALY